MKRARLRQTPPENRHSLPAAGYFPFGIKLGQGTCKRRTGHSQPLRHLALVMHRLVGLEIAQKPLLQIKQCEILYLPAEEHAAVGNIGKEIVQHGRVKAHVFHKTVAANNEHLALFHCLNPYGKPVFRCKQKSRSQQGRGVYLFNRERLAVAAGHFSLRMGVPEGKVFKTPILEYSYKNDDLHDPFINHYYALALDLATQEELDTIAKYAFKVNEVLKKIMLDANIRLIDFKLEFGRLSDGTIILADEISPDTCRFWDATTGAHLDKDLFRRSLGGEADAYQEVMKRLLG